MLFIISVAFMLFSPGGTLNPTEPAFYFSIGAALLTYAVIVLVMRRYQTDKGYQSPLTGRFKMFQSIVFMSIAFMAFLPYGTFDPRRFGFYGCIVMAVLIEVSVRFFLRKFRSQRPMA